MSHLPSHLSVIVFTFHATADSIFACVAGHTSWSTSGLGYLSLWALGKLRAFDGRGHPWRLLAGLLPLFVAVWIGITRLQARPHSHQSLTGCPYPLKESACQHALAVRLADITCPPRACSE